MENVPKVQVLRNQRFGSYNYSKFLGICLKYIFPVSGHIHDVRRESQAKPFRWSFIIKCLLLKCRLIFSQYVSLESIDEPLSESKQMTGRVNIDGVLMKTKKQNFSKVKI